MIKHDAGNWRSGLGTGMLPVGWHRWETTAINPFRSRSQTTRSFYRHAYQVEPGDLIATLAGRMIPFKISENSLQTLLRFIVDIAPRPGGILPSTAFKMLMEDRALKPLGMTTPDMVDELVKLGIDEKLIAELFLFAVGPLFAEPYGWGTISMYGPGPSQERNDDMWIVPRPPAVVGVDRLITELRLIRGALLMVEAIHGGNVEALDRLVRQHRVRERDFELHVPSQAFSALYEGAGLGTGDTLGEALWWLRSKATRAPMSVGVVQVGREQRLVPRPGSPGELIWLSLAHTAGAITLPFDRANAPQIHFCAECRNPLFSSRLRKSGKNFFCDPLPGKERSDCANRFHSRQGKQRQREGARLAGRS